MQDHLNLSPRNTTKRSDRSPHPTLLKPQAATATNVVHRLDYFERTFVEGRSYLMGDAFSVADAYLFVVLTWTRTTGIGLKNWPKVSGFVTRVAGRERVQEAMSAEGLL